MADTPTDRDTTAYLQSVHMTMLTPDQAKSLDAPIRIKEVITAISRLKLLKAPGPDGFPTLFYKKNVPHTRPDNDKTIQLLRG